MENTEMIKIPTQMLISAWYGINKKEFREPLKGLCFEFDTIKDKPVLHIVATDGVLMVCNTLKLRDNKDIEFCKKHFSNRLGIKIDRLIIDKLIKGKDDTVELGYRDDFFILGTACEVYDNYPMWHHIAWPGKDMKCAYRYCGFDKDVVARADKIIQNKAGNSIMLKWPMVLAEVYDKPEEKLAPHYWITDWYDYGYITTLVIMPLRIE